MSGEINFSGLATGIDFNSLVDQLVEAEMYQAKKLETWKQEWQSKTDKLNELNTKFLSAYNAMDILSSETGFITRQSSIGNSTIADIAVDSTATPGSYRFTVADKTQHIIESRGLDSGSDIALNDVTESFTISIEDPESGTVHETITVDGTGGKTLDDIASEINAGMSEASAEVISDNSSSNSARLKIVSENAGTEYSINITQTNTNLFDEGIDDVEAIDAKGGDTFTSNSGAGNYTGHVNKRFVFEVTNGGTVGSDTVELRWTDSVENKTGTITVNAGGTFDVAQGVQVTFADGQNFTKRATYAIDAFNPDIQLAQDSGLAQAEKEVHSGFSDADTTAITTTAATFSYSYAGVSVPAISVEAGSTLQDLVDLINDDPDNPGVRATIINDGTGTANSYHMVLTGENTGAANKIEDIDYSSFSAGVFKNGSFDETQSATNSMIKLDSYPSNEEWLQNSTNLIDEVIDGASITIKSAGTTDITISNDVDAMKSKIMDFVDAYNDTMSYIKELTEVVTDDEGEAESDESGELVGNYGVYSVESDMKLFIASRAEGFQDGLDEFILLPQIGISTGDNSQLEVDEEALMDALNNNPEAVVSLFSDDNVGVVSGANVAYAGGTSSTEPGYYHFKINVDGSGEATSATYWEDGDTEADGWTMKIDSSGKFATATSGSAKGMALQITGGVSTTLEGTVRIRQGKAKEFEELKEKISNSESGTLKVLTKNYENIMDNIDVKIERELRRVEMVEKREKNRYARLEVTIQSYNSQMESLQSELAKLS